MKKIVLLFGMLLSALTGFSQKNADFGLFIGTSYYLGELNSEKQFYSSNLAYGLVYRYNLNSRYAFKLSAIVGSLSGDDKDFENGFQQIRNHAFKTQIADVAVQPEFNFFQFVSKSKKIHFSPYVTAGVALLISPAGENESLFKLAIPFGVGTKLNINDRFNVALEWSYRKTFTDYLDQLPGDYLENEYSERQKSYDPNKDWYSFFGVILSFRPFIGNGRCPAYGNFSQR